MDESVIQMEGTKKWRRQGYHFEVRYRQATENIFFFVVKYTSSPIMLSNYILVGTQISHLNSPIKMQSYNK